MIKVAQVAAVIFDFAVFAEIFCGFGNIRSYVHDAKLGTCFIVGLGNIVAETVGPARDDYMFSFQIQFHNHAPCGMRRLRVRCRP